MHYLKSQRKRLELNFLKKKKCPSIPVHNFLHEPASPLILHSVHIIQKYLQTYEQIKRFINTQPSAVSFHLI
jgi:hypothetical protein